MFNAVHGISFGYVLCGVIWAAALGLAAGNYACSLVHRLPRKLPLLDKTPYCGSCGTLLQPRDLFPVISALLLKHRCRYCGAPFPATHTWTEGLIALLFVLAFFQYNFSQPMILVCITGTFLITLAAIEANEGMILNNVLLCVIVFGAMLRILQDGEIYNLFWGAMCGLMLGVAIKYKEVEKIGHVYRLPTLAKLLAAAGICIGLHGFLQFLIVFAVFYGVSRIRRVPVTIPFSAAAVFCMLYPDIL